MSLPRIVVEAGLRLVCVGDVADDVVPFAVRFGAEDGRPSALLAEPVAPEPGVSLSGLADAVDECGILVFGHLGLDVAVVLDEPVAVREELQGAGVGVYVAGAGIVGVHFDGVVADTRPGLECRDALAAVPA